MRKHTLIKNLKKIRLEDSEKDNIRGALLAFMKENPLVDKAQFRLWRAPHSWFFRVLPSGVAFALVFGIAGITSAAELALPGDILYPVKIYVNESVRQNLALTADARAEWFIERAERRLEEIEKLAVSGRLNSKVSAEVSKSFSQEVQKAAQEIKNFTKEGKVDSAARASTSLEAALLAHKKILQKAVAQPLKKLPESENILKKVEEKKSEAQEARKEIEKNFSRIEKPRAAISAQNRKRTAEKKIQEVKKFIEVWQKKLGATTTEDVLIKLESANTSLERGDADIQKENYSDAFSSFQKAQRIAQEAKILLKAKKNLQIEIRATDGENGKEKDSGKEIDAEEKEKPTGEEKQEIKKDEKIKSKELLKKMIIQ